MMLLCKVGSLLQKLCPWPLSLWVELSYQLAELQVLTLFTVCFLSVCFWSVYGWGVPLQHR